MKPFYIAGPMTGIPQFNFPAFEEAAKELRARGVSVISPTELEGPEWYAAAMSSPDGNLTHAEMKAGETWGTVLGRDVTQIADNCCGVILLDGWHKSRGARLEAFVAIQCGMPTNRYDGDGRHAPYSHRTVMDIIAKHAVR